jgi:PilZ domain
MSRRFAVPKSAPARQSVVLDPDNFPALAAALDRDDGDHLRGELENLLGYPLKKRAPRRHVSRMARLRASNYDEVVLVKDLSSSGVRLLVQSDQPLDLREMMEMQLIVMLPQGRRTLPVCVVRLCGQEGFHFSLACRFLARGADTDRMVQEIRNHIFGDVENP